MAAIDVVEPLAEEELPVHIVSGTRQVLLRLWRNRSAMVGIALLLFVALLAVFAPLIARYNPDAIPANFSLSLVNQLPSGAHWFGTDYLGRDTFARLIYGTRVSLPAGIESVLISFLVGVPIGVVAGFGPKLVDDLLMRFVDMLLAFPGLLLAIGIVTFLGPSLGSVIIAIGVAGIPGYARVARGLTLQAKQETYVLAAHVLGTLPLRLMWRHILPNVVAPLVVLATLNLSGAILGTAGLSFLGLGTQPPTADWGTMLYRGYQSMFQTWAALVFPAAIIVVTVFGINLFGDGLADALNPGSDRG